MKLNLKKAFPVLATGLMLGVTAFGAMAYDLGSWPAPFVEGGVADVTVVYGADAMAIDAAAAADIVGDLQAALGGVTTETGETVTGEAVKIEASNNKLNLNETFASIEGAGFDDDELPTVLADGTYRADDGEDFPYIQKIEFGSSYPLATFRKDTDYTDPDKPYLMIYGDDYTEFLNYTLDFTKAAASTNTSGTLDDFEDTQIEILGNTYDIVNAEVSGTKITLDLMTGPVKATLQEDEEATFTVNGETYTVKLVMIDSNGRAKFIVNGEETDPISEGGTYKFKNFDMEMGVTEVLRQDWSGGKRQATFYLGSQKLRIEDSDYTSYGLTTNVELNDEDVEDLYANVFTTWDGTDLKIDKIVFTWYPQNEIFITEDEPAVFPGLGSFKITFEGLKKAKEEKIEIKDASSSALELVVPLETGTVTIPFLYGNGTTWTGIGKDATHKLVTSGSSTVIYEYDDSDGSADQYLIVTDTTNYESYLVSLRVYTEDGTNYTKIKDEATGQWVCENLKAGDTCAIGSAVVTINSVNVAGKTVNLTLPAAPNKIYTEEGLVIYLPYDSATAGWPAINLTAKPSTYTLKMVEESIDTETSEGGAVLNFTLGWTSDAKATVSAVPDSEADNVIGYSEIDDTDDYAAYSKFGTYILYKTGGSQDTVEITYPGEAAEMVAYVAEETASIVVTTEPTTTGAELGSVTFADTELTDELKAKNLIVIGGSAVNRIAAELLDLPYPTYGTDEVWVNATGVDGPGKAIVKLMANPYTEDKYALLIAGWEGTDTQRAAKALIEGIEGLAGKDTVLLDTSTENTVVIE